MFGCLGEYVERRLDGVRNPYYGAPMPSWSIAGLLIVLLAVPAQAGGAESSDHDQPYQQATEERLPESVMAQVLDMVQEYFDVSGRLDPDPSGEEPQRLRFKFYPEGKSKSDEHYDAEGWFGPSRDFRQQEFSFRFSVPRSSGVVAPERPGNVL